MYASTHARTHARTPAPTHAHVHTSTERGSTQARASSHCYFGSNLRRTFGHLFPIYHGSTGRLHDFSSELVFPLLPSLRGCRGTPGQSSPPPAGSVACTLGQRGFCQEPWSESVWTGCVGIGVTLNFSFLVTTRHGETKSACYLNMKCRVCGLPKPLSCVFIIPPLP